jgi:hypothetical protein
MSNDGKRRRALANYQDEERQAIPVRRGLFGEGIAMPVQPPSKGPVSAHPGSGVTPKQPEK